jgi:transcriptional regulator
VTPQSLDLLQGTVDVLILKTLSWEPLHGYAIAKWIEQRSGGELGVADAALYQALHRLERRGWIASEWGLSENNRRAKYYRLTSLGRQQLRPEVTHLRRYVAALFKVLELGQRLRQPDAAHGQAHVGAARPRTAAIGAAVRAAHRVRALPAGLRQAVRAACARAPMSARWTSCATAPSAGGRASAAARARRRSTHAS